ncbi:MAG: hypothetical protein KatS3mg105_4719 [Gemmatales bacterium]|nr:MAG: hypothetical protein KatS3mg105_4719 [Gemmatales bacterium]
MGFRRLWIAFAAVIVGSFAVLGYYGGEIYRQAPPIPDAVVSVSGESLFSGQDIRDGQNVWQSIGGQQLGSVWGHGAYVAPDWSADWLHRECLWLLERWARRDFQSPYEGLSDEQKAVLAARLKREMRTNTYDPASRTLKLSRDRASAVRAISNYYAALFGDAQEFPDEVAHLADGGKSPRELREAYAMPANTIRDHERMRKLNAFFFWASWACATERSSAASGEGLANGRKQSQVTYTNNWPAESLVGNAPSGPIVVWSVISFVLLLAGIGALAWHHAALPHDDHNDQSLPARDPLLALQPTPSMQATLKYFWVVIALLLVQIGLGAVTAHYGVEGEGVLRHPAGQVAALLGDAHLAHTTRHLLDRDGMAGDGPVHRACCVGSRAKGAGVGR